MEDRDKSPPAQLLRRPREKVRGFLPTPTARHGPHKSAVPVSLAKAPFVFVRKGAHRTPLERPYEGPFRVLERKEKTFKIERGTKTELVSIDRLKPAHLDIDNPVAVFQSRGRGRPHSKLRHASLLYASQETERQATQKENNAYHQQRTFPLALIKGSGGGSCGNQEPPPRWKSLSVLVGHVRTL